MTILILNLRQNQKEHTSQNVQREFRTSVIDDTQEVRRVGLEDDEFVFALSNTET